MVHYRRHPSNHLLRRPRPTSLLLGSLPMVHRQIRDFLLLERACLRCGSCRRSRVSLHWPRREYHAHQAFCVTSHESRVMCYGFATTAGSVLIAYIGMGVNPQALVSSYIMSIPASLAISHMRYPEVEKTLTAGRVIIPDDDKHKSANALHAFANGAWLGIKIAGMIIGTLLVILALLGMVNDLLTWWFATSILMVIVILSLGCSWATSAILLPFSAAKW